MLKQYIYHPRQCGMHKFPPGITRLDTSIFRVTEIPENADVFVVPPGFHTMTDEMIMNLRFMDRWSTRHVMLNVSDAYNRPPPTPMPLLFRCDMNKSLRKKDPDSVQLAWPVEDLGNYVCPRDFRYDVCFVGWVSTKLMREALDIIQTSGMLNSFVKRYDEFYGYLSEEEQKKRRGPFLDAMQHSRFSISVRSIPCGVIRYRFYEALSMGRIPIMINDGAVLPFDDQIEYRMLRIGETEIHMLPKMICMGLDAFDFERAGDHNRKIWQKHLNCSRWPTLMAEICADKLEKGLV